MVFSDRVRKTTHRQITCNRFPGPAFVGRLQHVGLLITALVILHYRVHGVFVMQ